MLPNELCSLLVDSLIYCKVMLFFLNFQCALYESGLSDLITLNFDLSGIVLGVSISPNVPYCKGEAMIDSDITNFNTTVEVVQTATGPV